MKNLSSISDNKDIITKEYLVAGYEPLLPATPSEPTTKYLNGLKQWSSITQGPPGKSAYQSAVEGGYTGTESEFYAALAEAGTLPVQIIRW